MEINKHLEIIQKSSDVFFEKNLNSILNELEKNKIRIERDFTNIKIRNINKKSWGVYVFYITPKKEISTYENLNKLWETNSKNQKLISPKVIKSRFKKLTIDDSHCLYVGKSEDLSKRIEQHIHQKTKASTYGLKLSEHDQLHSDNTFEFSYFILEEKPVKEKEALKFLLVNLEKRIRAKFSPLIGKQ